MFTFWSVALVFCTSKKLSLMAIRFLLGFSFLPAQPTHYILLSDVLPWEKDAFKKKNKGLSQLLLCQRLLNGDVPVFTCEIPVDEQCPELQRSWCRFCSETLCWHHLSQEPWLQTSAEIAQQAASETPPQHPLEKKKKKKVIHCKGNGKGKPLDKSLWTRLHALLLTWKVYCLRNVAFLVFIWVPHIKKLNVTAGQHGLQLWGGHYWRFYEEKERLKVIVTMFFFKTTTFSSQLFHDVMLMSLQTAFYHYSKSWWRF